jgi:hypothetical protein
MSACRVRIVSDLNQIQLMTGLAASTLGEVAKVVQRSTDKVQSPGGHPGVYKSLYTVLRSSPASHRTYADPDKRFKKLASLALCMVRLQYIYRR